MNHLTPQKTHLLGAVGNVCVCVCVLPVCWFGQVKPGFRNTWASLGGCDIQENSGFQDVLVSLLLGRGFAFGRLPEGTVEDWLWYRLHLAPREKCWVNSVGDEGEPFTPFTNGATQRFR